METYETRVTRMRADMARYQRRMAIALACWLAFIVLSIAAVVSVAVYLYRCN